MKWSLQEECKIHLKSHFLYFDHNANILIIKKELGEIKCYINKRNLIYIKFFNRKKEIMKTLLERNKV